MKRPAPMKPGSRLRAAALLACSVLLAGCSGEPSATEIRRAAEADLEAQLAALRANPFFALGEAVTGSAGAEITPLRILELRKLAACAQTSEREFRCEVEMEVEAFGERQKGTDQVVMVRGKDRWETKGLPWSP